MTRRTLLAMILGGFGLVAVAVIAKSRYSTPAIEPGVRIVYSLDLDTALDDRATDIARDLETRFLDLRVPARVTRPLAPGEIVVTAPDAVRRTEIAEMLRGDYRDTIEIHPCAPDPGELAICFRVSETSAQAIKQAALDNAVDTIRRRIDSADVDSPAVIKRGDQIVVELPELGDRTSGMRDLIARSGKLEFKVVDDGSSPGVNGRGAPFMQQLFARVGNMSRGEALAAGGKEGDPTDPLAKELGVYADVDHWRPEDQPDRPHNDYYLKAFDQRAVSLSVVEARRFGCKTDTPDAAGNVACDLAGWQVIDRYLAQLSATDRKFVVPDDHQIAYERAEPSGTQDARPYWRSYYLWRTARLTGRAIANAEGQEDPNTGRPIVLLDFSRDGARIFGDLTAEIVGQKLATMLDGTITSAPIINGPIRGGRASITMGGSDPVQQRKDRDELIHVLKAGSLPAPLREESWSRIGPP
jgi:protein-export membrane protein SecD